MSFKDKIRALGGPGGDHDFNKVIVVLNETVRLFCLKDLQFLDEAEVQTKSYKKVLVRRTSIINEFYLIMTSLTESKALLIQFDT